MGLVQGHTDSQASPWSLRGKHLRGRESGNIKAGGTPQPTPAPGHPERDSHLPKPVPAISALSLTIFPFLGGQEGDAMPLPPSPEAGAAGCIAAQVLFCGGGRMQGDDKVWSQSLEPSSLCVGGCPAGFLPRAGVWGGSEAEQSVKQQMGLDLKSPAPSPPRGMGHRLFEESLRRAGEVKSPRGRFCSTAGGLGRAVHWGWVACGVGYRILVGLPFLHT